MAVVVVLMVPMAYHKNAANEIATARTISEAFPALEARIAKVRQAGALEEQAGPAAHTANHSTAAAVALGHPDAVDIVLRFPQCSLK